SNIFNLKFDWGKAKELLSQGWMVYLGAIFAMVYMKIDQIMLRWYDGSEAVGIYAVAAQISEAWYFVPSAIVASFFPKLIKLREKSITDFNVRFQQLLDAMLIMGVAVAILVTLCASWIISVFFGDGF